MEKVPTSRRHRPDIHPPTRHGSTGLQPGEPRLKIKCFRLGGSTKKSRDRDETLILKQAKDRLFLNLQPPPPHRPDLHLTTRHGSTGLQPGEPSLKIKGL